MPPSSDGCLWAPPGLQVLETCVKNCGHRFHVLVASQDFVEGVLVRTILPKNNPPTIVHDKVLNLLQVSAGRWSRVARAQCQLPSLAELWALAWRTEPTPLRPFSCWLHSVCWGPPWLSADWTF